MRCDAIRHFLSNKNNNFYGIQANMRITAYRTQAIQVRKVGSWVRYFCVGRRYEYRIVHNHDGEENYADGDNR